jgi:adenylate cyclase
MERRLAAILAGDVAGYSRLMEADEEGTLARLRALRAAVIDPAVTGHRGRVFKTTGDGFLAEFASVVDAARCASALQAAFAAHEPGIEAGRRIVLRLGLNLGDVVVEDGDVHGDGVNVAARLEALAEPGAICVSAAAYEQLRGKLELAFEDLGEQALKNIARPVRVYRIGAARGEAPRPALPLPDKPSLVVLPFQNMSGDAEQEYFADGMTEEITTALSRIRQFFVIARNTAFTYKGRKLDLKQVGRELGVRYLLEGSVRKAGTRVRITGQLIEAESGTHLWADKFDGALEDVFDLQDRVTSSVVGAIEPSIARAEIERARRKPPENLQAYDLILRAIGESKGLDRARVDIAIELARRAADADPQYALAWAAIANWTAWRKVMDWMNDPKREGEAGLSAAHRAVELGQDDPEVLRRAAWGIRILGDDPDTAIEWLDRAMSINPNSALALGVSAMIRANVGAYELAKDHAKRAIRLSPFETETFAHLALGISQLCQRNLPEALVWLRQEVQQHPRNTGTLYYASALAHSGRIAEARAVVAKSLPFWPTMTITKVRDHRRIRIPADLEFIIDGLRMAGLPE